MLTVIFFFIVSFLIGRRLVLNEKIVGPRLKLLLALCAGSVFLTGLFFAAGLLGQFNSTPLWLILIAISAISLFKASGLWTDLLLLLKMLLNWRTLWLLALFIWFFGRSLFVGSDGAIVAGDRLVWVDWPLHIGMASSFAWGNNFPPQNPTFAGILLIYPFMSDFLSGAFMRLGVSLRHAFIIPGIVLSLVFCGLYLSFVGRILSHVKAKKVYFWAQLALIICLFWGGLGFVFWIGEALSTPGEFARVIANPPREYSFYQEKNIWFFTFLFSEILPQRAFLFGLPLFMSVVSLLWIGWSKNNKKLLILAGLLSGVSPFFHTHTFMSIGFFVGSFMLIELLNAPLMYFVSLLRNRKKQALHFQIVFKNLVRSLLPLISKSFAFAVPFVLLTLPQLPYFLMQSRKIPVVIGWMAQGESLITFWFKNTGFFIPLALIGLWLVRKNAQLRNFAVAAWVLFLLPNIFSFAPWGYDNLKILTFWYLLSAPFVVITIIYISQMRYVGKVLAIILFVSLTATGVLEISRLVNTQKTQIRLWGKEDQQMAKEIIDKTPADSVVLTAAIHDHPVVSLAGRKIVIGFPGNSWSWGISGWDTREKDVHTMYKGGEEASRLWKAYGVRYIMVSDRERYFEKNINELYIKAHADLFLQNGTSKLYKIKE